jgi:hypothetical protein
MWRPHPALLPFFKFLRSKSEQSRRVNFHSGEVEDSVVLGYGAEPLANMELADCMIWRCTLVELEQANRMIWRCTTGWIGASRLYDVALHYWLNWSRPAVWYGAAPLAELELADCMMWRCTTGWIGAGQPYDMALHHWLNWSRPTVWYCAAPLVNMELADWMIWRCDIGVYDTAPHVNTALRHWLMGFRRFKEMYCPHIQGFRYRNMKTLSSL